MENYIFWSEIESGFEEPGGTPPARNPRSTPGAIPQAPVLPWPHCTGTPNVKIRLLNITLRKRLQKGRAIIAKNYLQGKRSPEILYC